MNKITVEASYPGPGKLNLVFNPPLQTWRFPGYARENDGRRAALDACRKAVRARSAEADPPTKEIEAAVEAALAELIKDGMITVP